MEILTTIALLGDLPERQFAASWAQSSSALRLLFTEWNRQ
jgi:hypothetical protein